MYFIASGIVQASNETQTNRLSEGDYFGEVAIISRGVRTATVTASTPTDLLVLDVDDVLRLLDQFPAVKQQVEAVAEERHLH